MHGGSEYYNYVIILKPVEIMLAATLPFTITVLSTLSGHRVPFFLKQKYHVAEI